MAKFLRYGQMNEDIVLDELTKLKKDWQEDENQLAKLAELKNQTKDMASIESKLGKFCEMVKQNLNGLTLQDKRLALDALDIKVIATNDGAEITVSVPLEFITTGQTSGMSVFSS